MTRKPVAAAVGSRQAAAPPAQGLMAASVERAGESASDASEARTAARARKVSISLDPALVAVAEESVAAGRAESVSAWFADAAARKAETELLQRFLDELEQELGPIPETDIAAAERAWSRLPSF